MPKKCQKNDSQSGKCKKMQKTATKMTPNLGNAKQMPNKCKENATENAK